MLVNGLSFWLNVEGQIWGEAMGWASRGVFLAGLTLVSVFSTSPSFAQVESLGNWRVGGFAGAFVPNVESWGGTGTLSGIPFTASGKLALNTGWATGALLGYSFEDVPHLSWLNIDAEVGYVSSNFHDFEGTIALSGLGNLVGATPLHGTVHTTAGFVNFLATPFGIRQLFDGRFTPFFGAGPGVASSTAKILSIGAGPTMLPINASSNETDFAFDALLGADFVILPETAPGLELGASYEFTQINIKHLGTGAGIQANAGPASGSIFGLVLEYRFGFGR